MKSFIITCIFIILFISTRAQFNLNYSVENHHEVNTRYSELSLVPYGNAQILVSDRGVQNKKNQWMGNAPFNLYLQDSLGEFNLMSPKLNSDGNDGPIAVHGNIMYITTNNKVGQIDPKTRQMIYRLCISKAELKDGKWEVNEIPELTNKKYSYAHPTLSADGKTLYFVSDRPGGFGATDIYKCFIQGDRLSEPENLGPNINTQYEEQFPFYHESGYLFYSSRRKGGKGGLDIYVSKKLGANQWMESELMGGEINTQAHESSIYLNNDMSAGYFTSNRMGGHGSDDIYILRQVNIKQQDNLLASTQKNNHSTIDKGSIKVDTPEPKDQSSDSRIKSPNTSLETAKVSSNPNRKMLVQEPTAYTLLESKIIERNLNNAYFNSNSSDLSEEAIAIIKELSIILNEDESAIIELHAHTDARGDFESNAQLSERRARAVIKALEREGVSTNRIRYLAYGETSLAINTKEEARMNRRVEFKIVDPNRNRGSVSGETEASLRSIYVLEKDKFYVQVAAINKSKTINRFNLRDYGVPISYLDKGMYKYVIGPYLTYEDATQKLTELKSNYPGVFIYLNTDEPN
ncbi:MAG: OmpA family protein [Chitinophagales bacterium]